MSIKQYILTLRKLFLASFLYINFRWVSVYFKVTNLTLLLLLQPNPLFTLDFYSYLSCLPWSFSPELHYFYLLPLIRLLLLGVYILSAWESEVSLFRPPPQPLWMCNYLPLLQVDMYVNPVWDSHISTTFPNLTCLLYYQ